MIRIKQLIFLSTVSVLSLTFLGCGDGTPSTTALSLAGTTNQYYNQIYTYTATLSNLGSTQSTGITSCVLNISGDARAYLQLVNLNISSASKFC